MTIWRRACSLFGRHSAGRLFMFGLLKRISEDIASLQRSVEEMTGYVELSRLDSISADLDSIVAGGRERSTVEKAVDSLQNTLSRLPVRTVSGFLRSPESHDSDISLIARFCGRGLAEELSGNFSEELAKALACMHMESGDCLRRHFGRRFICGFIHVLLAGERCRRPLWLRAGFED